MPVAKNAFEKASALSIYRLHVVDQNCNDCKLYLKMERVTIRIRAPALTAVAVEVVASEVFLVILLSSEPLLEERVALEVLLKPAGSTGAA